MAEEPPDSGNRVTTALVYRAVDDLKELTLARLDTVTANTDAHFETVKAQLHSLAGLPGRVDGMERTLLDHENRLVQTERDRTRLQEEKADDASWRKTHLPQLLLSAAACAIALAALLVPLF